MSGPEQPTSEDIQGFLDRLLGVIEEYDDTLTTTQQAELLGLVTSSVFTKACDEEPGFPSDMQFPEFAHHILVKNARHADPSADLDGDLVIDNAKGGDR